MENADGLIKRLGLDGQLDLCRIEMKNGALQLFIPRLLREKLQLNGEHYLIGYADGNTLLLVKSSELEERLKPEILQARKTYARMREGIK